jgi:hypothetical protein
VSVVCGSGFDSRRLHPAWLSEIWIATSSHPAGNRIGRSRRRQRRRRRFVPRARRLYYNDHPDASIEEFDRDEYGAVLGEIERHVVEWERQQTDALTLRRR